MIYRLKEYKGDSVPVPQLVFSKLGIAEEYSAGRIICAGHRHHRPRQALR